MDADNNPNANDPAVVALVIVSLSVCGLVSGLLTILAAVLK